jgi:YebC/PmpR family DNA-binding regulatory protein
MAGHSKWSNIKRRKAKVDAQKSNIISKALRDVMLAARHGGGNPDGNFRLKVAIDKARAANVPMDSITRAIKRGTGEANDGSQIEELTYEAYGPGGTAIIIEAATDNRNRTASEVRHILSKHGGKLAEVGSVSWMFDQKGLIEMKADGLSEDDVLMAAIEAGASDIKNEDGVFLIYTEIADLEAVKKSFDQQGFNIDDTEITMIPKTTVELNDEDAEKTLSLIDALEEHDDISKVHANFDISDEVMAKLGA